MPSAPAISFATGAGVEEAVVEAAGVRTFVRYSPGTGPVLVLLPGGALDSSMLTWKKALEVLPSRFRVFVPDLPGYGRSAYPSGIEPTNEWYADWLAALVAELGLHRFALGGSSMSAAAALLYALRHPERVEKLVVSGAYGVQERVLFHEAAALLVRTPGLAALARRLLRRPVLLRLALRISVGSSDAVTDELVADSLAGLQGPRALDAFVRWLRLELRPRRTRTDLTPRLGTLGMPVLMLQGARDLVAPVGYARRAADHLPGAHFHVFDGAGHLVPREFPDAVNARLVSFLSS